jgi:hypothetical protein
MLGPIASGGPFLRLRIDSDKVLRLSAEKPLSGSSRTDFVEATATNKGRPGSHLSGFSFPEDEVKARSEATDNRVGTDAAPRADPGSGLKRRKHLCHTRSL